jgi:anthranilate phosphoribosyltransferase
LVVHAQDGLDEISIAAPTDVAELQQGEVKTYSVTPEQFGLQRASLSSLAITNAQSSLEIIRQVLHNQPGPARDIVVLNAGAAIYAADLVGTLEQGMQRAQQVLADGSALAKFEALIAYSTLTSATN